MDSRLRGNDACSRTAGMTTGGVALNERDLACKQLREWCPMDVLDFPLSRLCYAAHSEDAAEVGRAGLEAWLGQQLDSKNTSSPDLEGRLRSFELQIKYPAGNGSPAPNGDTRNWPAMDEMRPLRYVSAPIDSAWALLDPKIVRPNEEYLRPYHEVAAATIIRAMHIAARNFTSAWWASGTITSTCWAATTGGLAARCLPTTATRSGRTRSAISASCSKPPRRARPCSFICRTRTRARAGTTRITAASFWSCTRSGAMPISTTATTAGATCRARARASRRAISTRMSTRPRARSPAGPSRMAKSSTRQPSCPGRAGSYISKAGTTAIRSACWQRSCRPSQPPWPTAARCWTWPLFIRPRRASCASSSAAISLATLLRRA